MVYTCEGYVPGEHFEENTDRALGDIELTDSTELWLIQWPANQLKPQDFQGKELSLKLHRDGKLGSFESSGKTYDLMSFAAQEPDATVFVPSSSSSESKIVGKISRRVCLVNYPEPGELDKCSFISNANLSSQSRSRRSTSHRSTVLKGSLQGTSSAHSFGGRGLETPQPSRKKRHEDHSSRPSGRSSWQDSHVTDATFGRGLSHGEKTKKKRKVKIEE